MLSIKATTPKRLGVPASSFSGGKAHMTSFNVTKSTVPPPIWSEIPDLKVSLGATSTPIPKGAYHFMSRKGYIVYMGWISYRFNIHWMVRD